MRDTKSRRRRQPERSGIALIIMVLLIVVFGVIIWLDPMSLMKGSDSGMPWSEEDRIVRPDEEVKQPKQEQPEILHNLRFSAKAFQSNELRGGIEMYILTDGRVRGGWGGAYKPKPEITWEVAGASFKGNIDPSKIYSTEDGEDRSKLYFIAKGKFLILETNSATGIVRNLKGRIYVTGWLDDEYIAKGKVVLTSNKKSYEEYSWAGVGKKCGFIPDFKGSPFKVLF